jgi:hypothetical protein
MEIIGVSSGRESIAKAVDSSSGQPAANPR